MEITFSKRKILFALLALMTLLGVGLAAVKLSGRPLAKITGLTPLPK